VYFKVLPTVANSWSERVLRKIEVATLDSTGRKVHQLQCWQETCRTSYCTFALLLIPKFTFAWFLVL